MLMCITVPNLIKIGQPVVEPLYLMVCKIVALCHIEFFKFEFLNSLQDLDCRYMSLCKILL